MQSKLDVMSGICAIYRVEGGPAEGEELDALLVAGAHRGCDGVERRLEGPVAIGHLAQRSVDHRTKGFAATSDFSLSLTADTRLDREASVERTLIDRDLLPRSEAATDADLILAAYRLWGHHAVERLRGDFAFVLWDRERRTMLAARDRLGIKPLCFAYHDGSWFFASEAQQIVSLPGFRHRLDRRTIARYLAQWLPSDDRTPFEGIRRLEPGHRMVVTERGEEYRERYWSPGEVTSNDATGEELLHRLRDAVDRRLRRPSGPVAVLMSGGLDSCAVAAIAHETLGPELRPVTHAFETLTTCDERRFTEAMREKFGFPVVYNWPEAQSLFPPQPDHNDPEDPFLGWNAVHAPVFEKLEKAGTRVVLTGHGGDSVFGGSPLVYSDQLRQGQFKSLFDGLRRHARERDVALTRLVYHYLLAPRFRGLGGSGIRRIFGRPPLAEIPNWIRDETAEETGLRDDFDHVSRTSSWGRSAREEMLTAILSPGSVARAIGLLDRLGHRYGMDVRHPFLDADLVDYVLSLPPETFYSAGVEKIPIRRRLTQLPPAVRTRRVKTSFQAYLDHRLRGADQHRLLELLDPPVALAGLGFVDSERLASAVHDYIDGSDEDGAGVILFTANIESWIRTFPPVC